MTRAFLLLGAIALAGCDRPATIAPLGNATSEAKAATAPEPTKDAWKPKAGETCWVVGPKYQGKSVVMPKDYESMIALLKHIDNNDGPPVLALVGEGKAYLFPLEQVQVKIVRVVEEPYRIVVVRIVGGDYAGKEAAVVSGNLRPGK